MSDGRIVLTQFSTPTLEYQMFDFRSAADRGQIVDITGYTIKLAVKAHLEDPDSYELFSLDAVLDADPTTGKYSFTLTTEHTCFASGVYFGEIRWWKDGLNPAVDPPTDRVTIDYVLQQAVDVSL